MSRPPLIDAIVTAAHEGGGTVTFHGLDGDRVLPAQELLELALQRAARLRDLGIGPGDRVGIVGPNAPDWMAWTYATWFVGGTLVMLHMPVRLRDKAAFEQQTAAALAAYGCALVAADDNVADLVSGTPVVRWSAVDADAERLSPAEFHRPGPDELAMIMPTSGSTAASKGVGVRYGTLVAGGAMVRSLNPARLPLRSYLAYSPMAHGGGLVPLYGIVDPSLDLHLLTPQRFARDPASLFRLVTPDKAWLTGAASSAMAAVVRAVRHDPTGIDLSGVDCLQFGLELVDPAVVDALVAMADQLRLDPTALSARYGLSEGGTTVTEPGTGLLIDEVDLEALVDHGEARPAVPGQPTKRVVSCGRPPPGSEVRIAGEGDRVLPDRWVGEPQFRTSFTMAGYVGPKATDGDGFTADGWIRSGDLAYMVDGQLYPVGRSKEVIVRGGRKFHPQDIEAAASRGAGASTGACIAFAPIDGEEGQVVVAVEADARDAATIEPNVRAAVMNALGLVVRNVVVVPHGSLPTAPSGKMQRLRARDAYARGELPTNG